MRAEINLGEITRRLSEATGEGESFFSLYHAKMTPQQIHRFEVLQRSLDQMTTQLIETEIKRNQQTIQEALRKGEYFIVNITFNSIHSSIYMAYNNPGEEMKMQRDAKLADLQQEQELIQALMKVLKAIESRNQPSEYNEVERHKLQKAYQIYSEYFKKIEHSSAKIAGDARAIALLEEHVAFLEQNKFFDERLKALEHVSICANYLKEIANPQQRQELEALRERVRPPDPKKEMLRLFEEVERADGEANIYSAVVAFNNFAEQNSSEPAVHDYKRRMRVILKQKGLL
ncbi:MAG: hypothetical protein AB7I41_22445 [Candidatus Sericytochromatia bacterium]